ncbi:MAG: hypothetical protein Q8N76_07165 [Candidatus Omnitrophota bacterium]|nr:hypothetical protein [Candidatus Omnitrophota bacterium]
MLNLHTRPSTRIISIILAHVFLCVSIGYPADALRVPIKEGIKRAEDVLKSGLETRLDTIITKNSIKFKDDKDRSAVIDTFMDPFIRLPLSIPAREGYFSIIDDEELVVKLIKQLKEIRDNTDRINYLSSAVSVLSNLRESSDNRPLVRVIIDGLFVRKKQLLAPDLLTIASQNGYEYYFFAKMFNELFRILNQRQRILSMDTLQSVFNLTGFDAVVYWKALEVCNEREKEYPGEVNEIVEGIISSPDIGRQEVRRGIYKLFTQMQRKEGDILANERRFEKEFLERPLIQPLQNETVMAGFVILFDKDTILDFKVNGEEVIDLSHQGLQRFLKENHVKVIPEGSKDILTRWTTDELLESARERHGSVASNVRIIISKSGKVYYAKEKNTEEATQRERMLLGARSLVKVVKNTGKYVVTEFDFDWLDYGHIMRGEIKGDVLRSVKAKVKQEKQRLQSLGIIIDDADSNLLVKVERNGKVTVDPIDFEDLDNEARSASTILPQSREAGRDIRKSSSWAGTYVRKIEKEKHRLKLPPECQMRSGRISIEVIDTEKGVVKIRESEQGRARVNSQGRLGISKSLWEKIESKMPKEGLFCVDLLARNVVLIGVGDGIEIWPEDEFKKQKGFKSDLNLLKFRNDSGHEIFSGTYNTMLYEGNRCELVGDMHRKMKGNEVVLQVIPSQNIIRVFEKDAWLRFVRDEAPSDKIQLAEYNRAVFGSVYYGKIDEQYRIVIHEEIMTALGFKHYQAIQLIGCGEYFEIHPEKAVDQAAEIMSDVIMPYENPLEGFTGVHGCKIEEKTVKFLMPVHLTAQLKLRETSFLLQPMKDGCIRGFLADEWVKAVHKNIIDKTQAEAEAYLRRSFSGVFNVTSDSDRRISVPKAVRDISGFDSRDIVLMGHGGFFEIWPAEIYERKKAGLHMNNSETQSVFGMPMEVTPRHSYTFDSKHRLFFSSDFDLDPGQQYVLVQPVYGQKAVRIFINSLAWQRKVNQHLTSLNDIQSKIDFLRKVFGSVYISHIDSQNRLTFFNAEIRELIGGANHGDRVEAIRYNDGSFELLLQPSAISGSTLLSVTPGKESRRGL